jgi:hypothetical protein
VTGRQEGAGESFFGHGLLGDDPPDEVTPEQRSEILDWYARFHGHGDLELARFAPFWLDRRPDVFIRFRRWGATTGAIEGGLPPGGVFLLHVWSYAHLGNVEGAEYELIGARELGASRGEAASLVARLPIGSRPSLDVLVADWPHHGQPGLGWPESWPARPPESDELPAPMFALCEVHHALLRGNREAAASAAERAIDAGAERKQLLHTAALATVYVGEVGLDAVLPLEPLL